MEFVLEYLRQAASVALADDYDNLTLAVLMEREWGAKASRFIKAELKRADLGYKELAERLNKHGPEETETSITGKLARGTFAASFFLACLAVLDRDAVRLEEI